MSFIEWAGATALGTVIGMAIGRALQWLSTRPVSGEWR